MKSGKLGIQSSVLDPVVPHRTWLVSTGSGGARKLERRITAVFPDDRLIRTQDQGGIIHWRRGLPSDGFVIIIGGDGAWREALQSAPKAVTIGLLPAGSLSQAGIELGTDARIEGWRRWRHTGIQLGHVEGYDGDAGGHAIFFLMAGAGVEADAVARVRSWLKRWIGKWAYVWALIERLLRPVRKNIVVGIDGRHFRTPQVLVQNGAHYGGQYRVAATDVFTPGYRVLIWKYPGRCMWCLTMMCLMFGLPSAWLAHDMMAEQVRVRGVGKMRCQIDGDMGPALPLRIRPTSARKIAIAGKRYGRRSGL
ncbi:MAG: hypothetical protein Q9M27_05610 [Mariprofundaceae bacterium]|nr:hypothetical protein [Mariprofundaceae bacterium]